MLQDIIKKYDRPVPRYTSYPTAPHFKQGVGADSYREWLQTTSDAQSLSLYLHIPFCDSLCWFCGCHTKIVRRYTPIADYLEALRREIELVAEILGGRRPLRHVHFGGGSPTVLRQDDVAALSTLLRCRFAFQPDIEFAVEIDPRDADPGVIEAWAAAGATRASLGVQDINPRVQKAINRIQPLQQTRDVVRWLRESGIDGLNLDLMYGLPNQSCDDVRQTVDAALTLRPDRIALFGYAHVPWMKKHQRLIPEEALPDTDERFEQAEVAAREICSAGYVRIGLDHFARPGDGLERALAEGRLNRNFQGYTSDSAMTLIGLGASAIGSLEQGYVQNVAPIRAYKEAIREGRFAVARGIAISREDRLRRAVIERLMCDLRVDLDVLGAEYGVASGHFEREIAALTPLAADGLVRRDGPMIEVVETARPLLRSVCAVFDTYQSVGGARHSRAV